MRRRTFSLLAALVLAGCGGSSHGGSSSTSASESYRSGVTSLNAALLGGTDRAAKLSSAQKAFDVAYRRNPGDARVAMGYAVSTAALDATALGTAVEGKGTASRLSLLDGLGARLGAGSGTSLAAFVPVLAARPKTRAEAATLTTLAADLHRIVDRLTPERIDALEANPLTLSYPGKTAVVVKLGTVEGYALRSAAEAALGLVDGALAYSLDPGDYDPDALFLTQFATKVAAGAAIAPAEYLPGGDYGKPTVDAGTLLAELRTQWTGTANDGNLALTRLGTRTGTGWLTDLAPPTDDEKAAIKTALDTLKTALAGPISVPITLPGGTTTSLTVDLSAPLANPPADVRAFYPSLRPIPAPPLGTTPTTILSPVAGSVADPTLGGLVPGGLPTPLLYGRTLSVDTTTTQGEVAAWAFPLSVLSE